MTNEEKQALALHRIFRAKETLNEAEFLIENQKWNTAINRLYYACYYAVTALHLLNDINARTHNGIIQMFSLHFIKTGIISKEHGDKYSKLFEMRHSGDYGEYIYYEESQVKPLVAPARELILLIEAMVVNE